MMRKVIAVLLMVSLMLGTTALAEQSNAGRSDEELYEELIVGTSTSLSGNFFSDLWGSNTSDIDVRILLHAYSPVDWKAEESSFAINQTVVSGLIAEVDDAGNKQYILSLAKDLLYSDGTPITARDYVFSLLLSAAPQMAAMGGMTSKMNHVMGAEAYSRGDSTVFSGVRLLNDTTFSITIGAEYLPFFYELGLLAVSPYPISVIAPGCEVADEGEGAFIRNIDTDVEEPVFTTALLEETLLSPADGYMSYPKVISGSYMLEDFDADAHEVRLVINPYYKGDHDGRKPIIERLVYKYIQPDEMIAELVDGDVDLLNKCLQEKTIEDGMTLRAEGPYSMKQYMRSGLGFISFNCEQGPAQFQAVRQALAMCLDRDQFIADYLKNFGVKVNGYYGIGQWMTRLVEGSLTPPVELPENPTAQETKAYEDMQAEWAALSLEGLNEYPLNLEEAERLLTEDGWVLNEEGNPFDPANDTIRGKLVDGEVMLLDMHMLVAQDAGIEGKFESMQRNMETIGARLTVEAMPYEDLLERYYRLQTRDNDMFFLGTNFTTMFDPTYVYSIYDEAQGALNTTGLRDEKLMELAIDLNKTEAGDVLTYCQKWIAFQEYWNEVLPLIPIYSNIYFDFHTDRLQDYYIDQHITWGEAILFSYLSDAVEEEDGEEAGLDGLDDMGDIGGIEGLPGAQPVEGGPAGGSPVGGSPVGDTLEGGEALPEGIPMP